MRGGVTGRYLEAAAADHEFALAIDYDGAERLFALRSACFRLLDGDRHETVMIELQFHPPSFLLSGVC